MEIGSDQGLKEDQKHDGQRRALFVADEHLTDNDGMQVGRCTLYRGLDAMRGRAA